MLMQTADDDQLGEQLLLGATLIARHRHPLLQHALVEEQLDDLAVQVRQVAVALPLASLRTSTAKASTARWLSRADRMSCCCRHTNLPALPLGACPPAG
jgi:hypothetical protein